MLVCYLRLNQQRDREGRIIRNRRMGQGKAAFPESHGSRSGIVRGGGMKSRRKRKGERVLQALAVSPITRADSCVFATLQRRHEEEERSVEGVWGALHSASTYPLPAGGFRGRRRRRGKLGILVVRWWLWRRWTLVVGVGGNGRGWIAVPHLVAHLPRLSIALSLPLLLFRLQDRKSPASH